MHLKKELKNLPAELHQSLTKAMEQIQPPKTAEEVRDMLLKTEKGAVKSTINNCLTVLENDPNFAGAIAFNILAVRNNIVKPLWYERQNGPSLTDTDMKYFRLYMESTYGLTSKQNIEDAVDIAAHRNRFHPVRDKLNSLKWDGTERIRDCLHHFLGADADDYTYEIFKLFLLGAISRAFVPGIKFDCMLCLVGGQGAGKSTFFRFLAMNDEWFSDDLTDLSGDDVFERLQGHWIIEMSEMLATSNAKNIETIKSFISRQKETYRIRYDKHTEDRPRQCVFGGTSNTMDFLPQDRSGNRRFLPILVKQEEAEVHILANEDESRAYIEQVWAETMVIYRSGKASLKLTPEIQRLLKERQKDFMPEDTKAGMIQGFLDNYQGNAVCSKLIYKEALKHPFDEPKAWELREIGDIMNQSITGWQYFKNPRNFAGYGRQRGWERITPTTRPDNNDENRQLSLSDDFMEITDNDQLPF